MQSTKSSAPTRPAISLAHVTKRFGDLTAVNDLNLEVATGEVFAFLGPNGAGKSTTIKMLTALLRPTEGIIQLDGHDVARDPDRARRSFGIVFQDPSVDSELTAYENMDLHGALYGLSAKLRKQRIHELLKLVELQDRAASLVKTFSGGMIRRLEIARGLMHHPKILFLDEPTLGLDTQTRSLLWEYVTKLSRETHMTVFLTTHYLEEAEQVAGRIAFIDHGRIIAMGTTDQLTAQTQTSSLEQAYLALTGRSTRDDAADPISRRQLRTRLR